MMETPTFRLESSPVADMADSDLSVISTVIAEAKKSFQDSGVDNATLVKLERLWKKKLMLLAAEEEKQEDPAQDDEDEGVANVEEEGEE